MSNAARIADLAARIKAANEAYYDKSAPIMTDAAYDALRDELEKLDPANPVLAKVGAAPSGGSWPKAKHSIPMGSLKKCQFDDAAAKAGGDGHGELRTWWPGKPVTITHKLDGISIDLVYRKRQLVQAITRGDGAEGEDITRNVLLMEGAVRVLPATCPDDVNVRGEIVCRKSNFKAHFPGESNPRNTAAGTAKRQTGHEKAKYLTVVAYQYLPNGVPLDSKEREISTLTGMGFVTPPTYTVSSVGDVIRIFEEYVAGKRDALDWDIDGLVVDVDDRDQREAMGSHNMRPNGARALKFPHAQRPSVLRDIRWQVGKSGRLTPVADFDTVNLAGANVSKASLHNLDYIGQLAGDAGQQYLAEGDEILVARRNDVIPMIEAVIQATDNANAKVFHTPTVCPDCGTPVVNDGAYLVCPNGESCPAQISGAIKRWLTKIGVKHFGDALVDLLCETGKVERIADLYRLDPNEVAAMEFPDCRKVGGTADKAFRNLHAATTMPLHVFVGSLGIPLIGRSMAKTLVDGGLDSLNAMSKAKVADVAAIPGVGQTKAEAFCDGFWDLLDRGIITALLAHVTIAAKAVGTFTGKSICMTGFRDAQMEQAIEAQGGSIKGSVSKDLTILVTKDPTSNSGKAQKARQYGTEIIGIDEMWDRLGGRP
jgi:DNA ligase (NAD+)